jgi:hypothetical protein
MFRTALAWLKRRFSRRPRLRIVITIPMDAAIGTQITEIISAELLRSQIPACNSVKPSRPERE